MKERQRLLRQEWILEHVFAVILILVAGAFMVTIFVMIATNL